MKDPIFKSLTRPAMKFGVPYDALMVMVLLIMIIFIATNNMLYFLIYIPLHLIFFFVTRKDPKQIKLVTLWIVTKLISTGQRHFNAATASPREYRCNKRKMPI